MVNGNDFVKVRNLTNQKVSYLIPEKSIRRNFGPQETKEIEVSELRELYFKAGGAELLVEYLCVENEELASEFGVTHDMFTHEYCWTEKDIDRVLLEGSLDELADALDYAPRGIQDTLFSRAVELKIPDMNKRNYIHKQTGRDITKMITYAEYLNADQSAERSKPNRRRVQSTNNTSRRV